MKIQNKTSFHDNKVKEIIKFTMPKLLMDIFKVNKDMNLDFRLHTGDGYSGVAARERHSKYLVTINVAPFNFGFPFDEKGSKR